MRTVPLCTVSSAGTENGSVSVATKTTGDLHAANGQMKGEKARLHRCCNSSYTGNFTLRRGNKCAPLTHASAIPARHFLLFLSPRLLLATCFILNVLGHLPPTEWHEPFENEKEDEEEKERKRKKGEERYTPCNLPPYCSAFKDLY